MMPPLRIASLALLLGSLLVLVGALVNPEESRQLILAKQERIRQLREDILVPPPESNPLEYAGTHLVQGGHTPSLQPGSAVEELASGPGIGGGFMIAAIDDAMMDDNRFAARNGLAGALPRTMLGAARDRRPLPRLDDKPFDPAIDEASKAAIVPVPEPMDLPPFPGDEQSTAPVDSGSRADRVASLDRGTAFDGPSDRAWQPVLPPTSIPPAPQPAASTPVPSADYATHLRLLERQIDMLHTSQRYQHEWQLLWNRQMLQQQSPLPPRLASPSVSATGPLNGTTSVNASPVMIRPEGGNGRAWTVEVRNADVREVLTEFSRAGGWNLVPAPAVTGRVTLTLTRVDPEQALHALLRSQNLTVEQEGTLMWVRPR